MAAGGPEAGDRGKNACGHDPQRERMPSTVSLRYARALVDAVTGQKAGVSPAALAAIPVQLDAFETLLHENAELRILFSTPAISTAKKRAVLAELASRLELEQLTKNFLNVVIQHDRMSLLGEIAASFRTLLDERTGVAVAEITTARPLEEAEKQELAGALAARTGRQVRLKFSLDADLIGGVTARVGSTIYDGSVRGQLDRLRADLLSG
jgi:F-type H+-transporting ATPase subunit delta